MINQEQLKAILSYEPSTGWFTNLYWRNYNSPPGKRTGTLTCGRRYRKISINKVDHYEHRLAWLYVHGIYPKEIDHINGDGLDNRIDNLRLADRSQNIGNAHYTGGVSGIRGVYASGRDSPWLAQIQVDGRCKHLGYFDTIEEAYEAYKAAAELYFGEFAFHNRNPKAHPMGVELLPHRGNQR